MSGGARLPSGPSLPFSGSNRTTRGAEMGLVLDILDNEVRKKIAAATRC